MAKNNEISWSIIGITIIVILLIYSSNNKLAERTPDQSGLTFDIDLSSLSYQLPRHTKICIPETKQECNENGCKQIKATVFLLIDEIRYKAYRCDNKPCDSYDINIQRSGLFTNIAPLTPKGWSIKTDSENNYTETTSFGLTKLISYGSCTRIPPQYWFVQDPPLEVIFNN